MEQSFFNGFINRAVEQGISKEAAVDLFKSMSSTGMTSSTPATTMPSIAPSMPANALSTANQPPPSSLQTMLSTPPAATDKSSFSPAAPMAPVIPPTPKGTARAQTSTQNTTPNSTPKS